MSSAPPPQGYQPQDAGGSGYGQPTATNVIAIVALVVGILSIPAAFTVIFGVILGIAAIVLGVIGKNKSNEMGGSGRGFAIGGIVTGVIGLLISLLIAVTIGALIGGIGGAIEDGTINVDGTEFEIPTE